MSEQTAKELLALIDRYMPTVITGIDHLSSQAHQKPREDWTADDVAIMAAFSAAHHMMWRVVGQPDFDAVEYDLPSVLDLMNSLKKRNAVIEKVLVQFPETRSLLGEFEGRFF